METQINLYEVFFKTTFFVPFFFVAVCLVLVFCLLTDLITNIIIAAKKTNLKKRTLIYKLRGYDEMIEPSECDSVIS
ncbi:MAG: hypothetical protein P4L28_07250 [Paludibacteraceae bacterium]|nr:hypothetical protein [Paludibacteraceae bacterium]